MQVLRTIRHPVFVCTVCVITVSHLSCHVNGHLHPKYITHVCGARSVDVAEEILFRNKSRPVYVMVIFFHATIL